MLLSTKSSRDLPEVSHMVTRHTRPSSFGNLVRSLSAQKIEIQVKRNRG